MYSLHIHVKQTLTYIHEKDSPPSVVLSSSSDGLVFFYMYMQVAQLK